MLTFHLPRFCSGPLWNDPDLNTTDIFISSQLIMSQIYYRFVCGFYVEFLVKSKKADTQKFLLMRVTIQHVSFPPSRVSNFEVHFGVMHLFVEHDQDNDLTGIYCSSNGLMLESRKRRSLSCHWPHRSSLQNGGVPSLLRSEIKMLGHSWQPLSCLRLYFDDIRRAQYCWKSSETLWGIRQNPPVMLWSCVWNSNFQRWCFQISG